MKLSKKKAITEEFDLPEIDDIPKKKVKILPILLGITIVLAGLIFGSVYLYQKGYYNDRWYENTKINDVDVSGQTLNDSKKKILEKMGNYALTIKGRNDGSLTIEGGEIEFYFSLTNDFNNLFKKQHEHFSLFPGKSNFSTTFNISYNTKKLRRILKKSDLKKGSASYPIQKPKSAKVKFSETKEKFICVKEVEGNKLIFKNFLSAVDEAIKNADTFIDITDIEKYPDIYRKPKITSNDPELKKKRKTLNYSALRYIIWNMGNGITEQITPAMLVKWSTYSDGKITFDDEKIKNWVESFCQKYKTTGKYRLVKMHDGKYVLVKPGDYGWQIDSTRALEQAKNAINKKISKASIRAYLKEPSEENKKTITFRKKVPYANTAFQKEFGENDTKNDVSEILSSLQPSPSPSAESSAAPSPSPSAEIPENEEKEDAGENSALGVSEEDITYDYDENNFTEVSLKDQMVYVIRDGKVAFSCKCISGRPTPDRSTKPGAYFIKEHQTYRVLRGANYSTPVTNWVRITWSGTGFHSAKWQRWRSWSPTYYLTRGSHGCLNLSIEDSKTIYDMVKYREAVFIY